MDSATMRQAARRHRAVDAVAARQRGAVAIIVALSMFVLIGFAGLVLDLGRLYINKTELQSAADACALAAANELVCDPTAGACPPKFLSNAQNAGIFVARRNKRDFQSSAVVIDTADVRFSKSFVPNSDYHSINNGASVDSKFAMCIARSTGLLPWFMGVLGKGGANSVESIAVATLAPSDAFCDPAPMGICAAGPAPTYGLTEDQWLRSDFTDNGNPSINDLLTGSFRWVDYSAPAGGTPDLRDILAGKAHICGVRVGDDVTENGVKQGAKFAYNTRFGLYSNAYTSAEAPPDKTGYAYPTKHPPATAVFDFNEAANGLPPGQKSALADYQAKQGTNTRYVKADYPPPNPPNPSTVTFKPPPNENSAATTDYTLGVQRRLIMTPIISCAVKTKPILAMGCSLMLNPMGNGASTIFLEYLGLATKPDSPCRTAGLPGGGAGNGPLVPTLVQ